MAKLDGNQTLELTSFTPSGETYLVIWEVNDQGDGTTESTPTWLFGPLHQIQLAEIEQWVATHQFDSLGLWIDNNPQAAQDYLPNATVQQSTVLFEGPIVF